MKKFLTVLLVIAVMFTFSFGSAFADVSTSGLTEDQQKAYDAAVGTNNVILNAKFDSAWATIGETVLTDGGYSYKVTAKAYAELKNAALEAVQKDLYETAKASSDDVATLTSALNAKLNADAIVATINEKLQKKIVGAQFAIDYAEEVAKLDTVNTAMYVEADKAAAEIARLKVEATRIAAAVDSDSTMEQYGTTLWNVKYLISTGDTAALKEMNHTIEGVNVLKGIYEFKDTKTWKKVADAEADDAAKEALKSALKAIVAKNVADYRVGNSNVDATLIAAYTEA